MNLEEQIKLHKQISKQIEELEEKKKTLGAAILQQMTSKKLQIPGFLVRHCSRLSFSISLDDARQYKAVKLEEVVDKEKLKELYYAGKTIEGVKEVNFIQISELVMTP